jgi:hypothetical protein
MGGDIIQLTFDDEPIVGTGSIGRGKGRIAGPFVSGSGTIVAGAREAESQKADCGHETQARSGSPAGANSHRSGPHFARAPCYGWSRGSYFLLVPVHIVSLQGKGTFFSFERKVTGW